MNENLSVRSPLGMLARGPLRLLRGAIFRMQRSAGLRGPRAEPEYKINRYLRRRAANIVQVGSNDGIQGDPIADVIRLNPMWRVLFVEPLPHLFQRLTENYSARPNSLFANCAISNDQKSREIFYVDDKIKVDFPSTPFWYDQLASFERMHIVKHGQEFVPYIRQISVFCKTLSDLSSQYNLEKIDLLHIDTEGYDFEVIKQVDKLDCLPSMILYEEKHLCSRNRAECKKFLNERGYRVKSYRDNALAIRSSVPVVRLISAKLSAYGYRGRP